MAKQAKGGMHGGKDRKHKGRSSISKITRPMKMPTSSFQVASKPPQ